MCAAVSANQPRAVIRPGRLFSIRRHVFLLKGRGPVRADRVFHQHVRRDIFPKTCRILLHPITSPPRRFPHHLPNTFPANPPPRMTRVTRRNVKLTLVPREERYSP